jgi:hypothetical protein
MRDLGGTGLYIGAYGWIENITLSAPESGGQIDGRDALHDHADGGFIHAPGIAHAVTAGILPSARLTHARGDPNSDALDIDLSSARVRDATAVLDGMRRGQSLGALLGYRLERRLHEQSGGALELDRFIFVLRGLAPLRGGKLSEPGQPVEENLAASDVVDGLRLMPIAPETVRQKMIDGPDDQRYIQPPDVWEGPRAGEAEAVLAAIAALEETHDAVADLLLAESVFQLTSGNPARAAAALDVLGAGEAVPAEPDVIRTPRSGVPIQHRIAIVVPSPTPAPLPGWNPDAPRARAEPRLERWAQRALGDATTLHVSAAGRLKLSDASLCALDVLYDADGDSAAGSTLTRLHGALAEFGMADLPAIERLWELAAMLRGVMVGARALGLADVGDGWKRMLPDARSMTSNSSPCDLGHRGLEGRCGGGLHAAGIGAVRLAYAGASGGSAAQRRRIERGARSASRTGATAAGRGPGPDHPRGGRAFFDGAGRVGRAGPVQGVRRHVHGRAVCAAGARRGIRPLVGCDGRGWGHGQGRRGNTALAAARRVVPGADLGVRGDSAGARRARPRARVARGANAGRCIRPLGRAPLRSRAASRAPGVHGRRMGGRRPKCRARRAIAGLVLDQWTEVLPRPLMKTDLKQPDEPPTYSDVTTSAVAVNANAPGARPPQAILLALSADGAAWDDDRLVNVLDEARTLARMRTLTLQQIPYIGRLLPALYFRDWSLQGEPVIDWAKVTTTFDVDQALKFLSIQE